MTWFWIAYGLILLLAGVGGYYYKKWQYEILDSLERTNKILESLLEKE